MKKFFTALIIVYSILLGAACDRTKTLTEVDKLSSKFRIYGRNIAQTNNDAFEAGQITKDLHGKVLKSAEFYFKALDLVDRGVNAARSATGEDLSSKIDYLKRLMDVEVFGAFMDIVDVVTEVPPELKAKLETYLAAIRLLFASVTSLFAQVQGKPEELTYG